MERRDGARNLHLYAAANAVSRFGGQYQFLAVTALTYAMTGSALATALQMAVSGLPFILLARWAGLPADRFDPRRVVMAVSLVQAVLTLGYLLSSSVVWILLLNFLVSAAGVFHYPARTTLIPQMVGREHLLWANARLATVSGAVELLSPILAGAMLVRTGTTVAFLFNAFSFLVPAAAMLLLRLVEPVRPRWDREPHGSAFGPALTFLRRNRGMAGILAGYGAYLLGMWAVNAIFYPYTDEVLRRGPEVLGWSISAYFGAYTVTGFLLERWGTHLRGQRVLLAGYLVGAAVWTGYSFTDSVPLALLLSAFDGLVYTCAVTLLQTRIQEEAPPEERGRISGVVAAYEEAAAVVGKIGGGALAAAAGILPGIRLAAGLTGVLVLLVGLFARAGGRRLEGVA